MATSCVVTELHIEGKAFPLARWGAERYWPKATGRCGDCGVQPGGAHHLGCDIAECPRCRGQLLSCGCPFDEFPSEDYDDGGRRGPVRQAAVRRPGALGPVTVSSAGR